jgi:hypothetical protein
MKMAEHLQELQKENSRLQQMAAFTFFLRAHLWIGSTDGRAKRFVNGRHVPYVVLEQTRQQEAGTALRAFDGSCRPARFDVTDALKAGDNQLSLLCERYHLNELDTGGLIGPVVLFRDR